jgi:hypothetical protein
MVHDFEEDVLFADAVDQGIQVLACFGAVSVSGGRLALGVFGRGAGERRRPTGQQRWTMRPSPFLEQLVVDARLVQ